MFSPPKWIAIIFSIICYIPNCVYGNNPYRISSKELLLSGIKSSESPCNDFFNYACGGLEDSYKHNLTESAQYFSTIENVNLANAYDLYKLLNDSYPFKYEFERKAKRFYDSCMVRRSSKHLTPELREFWLRKILYTTDWKPLQDTIISGNTEEFDRSMNALMNDWNFQRLLTELHPTNPLFNIDIRYNHLEGNDHMILLTMATPRLKFASYYDDEGLMTEYKKYMNAVMNTFFGYDEDTVEGIFEVESELAKIYEEARATTDQYEYIPYQIKTMDIFYTTIKWREYFNDVFGKYNVNMHKNMIILEDMAYMDGLHRFLKFAKSKPTFSRMLNDYFLYGVVDHYVQYMPEDIKDLKRKMLKYFTKVRWDDMDIKYCARAVEDFMPSAISNIYEKHLFNREEYSKTIGMFLRIRRLLSYTIRTLYSLTNRDKSILVRTINRIRLEIGGSRAAKNNTFLDERFKEYDFVGDSFHENVVQAETYYWKHYYELLKTKHEDVMDWYITAFEANAQYVYSAKTVCIPAGLFKAPLFHVSYPDTLNYGGIGATIAHEIMHSLDSQNIYDEVDGRYQSIISSQGTHYLVKREKCFKEQYDKFRHGNLKLNPGSIVENVADNVGLSVGYKSVSSMLEFDNHDMPFHDVPLNQDQLYFVSYAQSEWGLANEEYFKQQMIHFVHPPSKFRILGSVANSDDFQRAFGCKPEGVRRQKCDAW